MPVPGRLSGKQLTNHLRTLAEEMISVTDAGDPITRAQALADLIWKFALGWTEEYRDDNGTLVKKKHPPVAWAMQYLFERTEGRAPVSMPENEGGLKAADKVSDLAKQRVNQRAKAAAGVTSGPPVFKRTKP